MRKISSVASIEEFFKFIVLKICIIIHDLIVNFVLGFKNQNHEYHLVCVCIPVIELSIIINDYQIKGYP